MKLVVLSVLCALASCSYPEYGFMADTGVAVVADTNTAAPDVADTFAPIDTSDATEVADTCACTTTERCVAGACLPYASCATLHTAAPSLPTGAYELDPDGAGPLVAFSAYCEMVDDGGGWTLALKLDGAQKTFVYESPLWTNDETLNPTSTALDTVEAKFASFSTMPFTSLRLGMLDGGMRRYIRLDVVGASLRAMFSGGAVTTTAGRAEWMKLMADPRLQVNCEAEGFNHDLTATTVYAARARLASFGNNEMDCGSPDSYIGFGAGFVMPHMCVGAEPGIVVGNYNPTSCGNTASVARATAAFGYIFLR